MSMSPELRAFLERRKTVKGQPSSHNSLQYPRLSSHINANDLSSFFELYVKDLEKGSNLGIVEMHKGLHSPILIDLDFRINNEVQESPFKINHINDFLFEIMSITQKFVILDNPIDIFVLLKPIRCNKDGTYKKDGVHIVIPNIVTHPNIQRKIRQEFMNEHPHFFDEFQFLEPIDKIYDEAVIENAGWLLYGSKKADDIEPWLVNYKLRYDHTTQTLHQKKINMEKAKQTSFVCLLAIRNKTILSPLTNDGENVIKNNTLNQIPIKKNMETKQNECIPSHQFKENQQIDDDVDSLFSDCTHAQSNLYSHSYVDQEEKEQKFEFVENCVMSLKNERANCYNKWMQVGWALRSIDNHHITTWIEFSKKSPKFVTGECEKLWINMREDDGALSMGSIMKWLKEDVSSSVYEEFELKSAQIRMMVAAYSSPNNIAKVMKLKYDNGYLYGKKKWYAYEKSEHRWRQMNNSFSLREKISDEILNDYSIFVLKTKKKVEYWTEKRDVLKKAETNDIDYTCPKDETTPEEKENIIKEIENKNYVRTNVIKRYNMLIKDGTERLKIFKDIVLRLRSTSFKDNIIKEASEIFNDTYMEKINKFDTNPNLIGFKNGVYDLEHLEFRDGDPNDYVTFTTGYNFCEYDDPEIQSYIMNFIKSITKNEANAEYLIKVMAYMLNGTKYLENFWFLTGAGRNGKGTLMTLLKKSLGDYYYEPSIEIITTNKANSSSANPEIAKANGKRILVCSEPDDTDSHLKFKANKLKSFRGNDNVQARGLFKDFVEFVPQFGMMIQMNNIPEMTRADEAIANTLKIIQFPYQFVPRPQLPHQRQGDPTIKGKFTQEQYYQQFMIILLSYYKKYIHGQQFIDEPIEVEEFTREYIEENNPLMCWFKENVDVTNNRDDVIPTCQMYSRYKSEFSDITSSMRFGKELSASLGLKSRVVKKCRVYECVKFKPLRMNNQFDDDE